MTDHYPPRRGERGRLAERGRGAAATRAMRAEVAIVRRLFRFARRLVTVVVVSVAASVLATAVLQGIGLPAIGAVLVL